jgi:excinuclease ABC subunit C
MEFERGRFPDSPGVYLMKSSDGTIIYVGKAGSLRNRLSQYFLKGKDVKTSALVSHISAIDFVITKDEKEALVLESNLIKGYQPKYNLCLKDAKHFSYLALTKEGFPRLLLARKNPSGTFRLKDAQFYGPFVEGSKRAISARYLRKLFRIRICGPKMPKKECLQFHLGNCDAPCVGKISQEEYLKNIDAVRSVLEGKSQAGVLIDSLRKRMAEASSVTDFERALSLRDQMESLKIFYDRQRVERKHGYDEDFIWFERIGPNLHVQVLRSRHGVIGKAEKHSAAMKEQEDPELSFCIQYYSEIPDKIYSNLSEKQNQSLNLALGTDAFSHPGREKAKVLDIAAHSLIIGEIDPSVLSLKERLDLENNPITIETFDISTLFGEESVGSMVRFVNGKPDKDGYRRFKIKTVSGQDDFAMMKEVVSRRYERLLKEGGALPDLVLIDGGAGQLHAAMDAMEQVGVRIPVAAIAKKEEEIYLPNRMDTVRMARSDGALKLLQMCRDEAHRFAVTYQRLRRGKKARE